jgi:hypothetical protein
MPYARESGQLLSAAPKSLIDPPSDKNHTYYNISSVIFMQIAST